MRYIFTIYLIVIIVMTFCADLLRAEEVIVWRDCVNEALIKHPELKASFEKINQARADKELTRSVIMPQVTGSASGTTSKGAVFGASAGGGQSDVAIGSTRKAKTTYDYNITGEQLLFDGFKTSFDLSSDERNITAAKYSYYVTSSNIRLRLRTAFASLLSAQELIIVTREIESRRRQNLELVRLRYEGGREHRGSLLTAEADLAQAIYDVNQAARNIYFSQRQLTKELGRSIFIPMTAQGALEVKDKAALRPDFDELVNATPFLQQLIFQKDAARFDVKSAYADFCPQVYASANIGNTNVDAFPDKNEWSAGLNFSLPIFTGGDRFAALSKAKSLLAQADFNEMSGRDSVILTLADTWTRLQNTIDNVSVQRKFLEATEERAKIARAEYSIGLMSFDSWIIIENNLVTAKKSFVNSQLSAVISEAAWIQAKGGTLEYDQK